MLKLILTWYTISMILIYFIRTYFILFRFILLLLWLISYYTSLKVVYNFSGSRRSCSYNIKLTSLKPSLKYDSLVKSLKTSMVERIFSSDYRFVSVLMRLAPLSRELSIVWVTEIRSSWCSVVLLSEPLVDYEHVTSQATCRAEYIRYRTEYTDKY